jgi:AcrR family transcriptional regulator
MAPDWIRESRTGIVRVMIAKLTSKGRRTRRRIVAAAAELMFEGGVAGTTMADVRVAAGVDEASFVYGAVLSVDGGRTAV